MGNHLHKPRAPGSWKNHGTVDLFRHFVIDNRSDYPIVCFITPDPSDRYLQSLNIGDPTSIKATAPVPAVPANGTTPAVAAIPGSGTGSLNLMLTFQLIKETGAEVFVVNPHSQYPVQLHFNPSRLTAGVLHGTVERNQLGMVIPPTRAGTWSATRQIDPVSSSQYPPSVSPQSANVGPALLPPPVPSSQPLLSVVPSSNPPVFFAPIPSSQPLPANAFAIPDPSAHQVATTPPPTSDDDGDTVLVDLFAKNLGIGFLNTRIFTNNDLGIFLLTRVALKPLTVTPTTKPDPSTTNSGTSSKNPPGQKITTTPTSGSGTAGSGKTASSAPASPAANSVEWSFTEKHMFLC